MVPAKLSTGVTGAPPSAHSGWMRSSGCATSHVEVPTRRYRTDSVLSADSVRVTGRCSPICSGVASSKRTCTALMPPDGGGGGGGGGAGDGGGGAGGGGGGGDGAGGGGGGGAGFGLGGGGLGGGGLGVGVGVG